MRGDDLIKAAWEASNARYAEENNMSFADVYSEGYIDATSDFETQLAAVTAERDELKASNRYALAVFRSLDRWTFEDSDHGLLIKEAVEKLEGIWITKKH